MNVRTWTTEPPTQPGWYWWRRTTGRHWSENVPARYRLDFVEGKLVGLGVLHVPVTDAIWQCGEWGIDRQ
jgi:hypothetical protein